jgi:hypothetical protein
VLKDHRFWTGVIVGYLLLVVFPQLNVRSMAVKKS